MTTTAPAQVHVLPLSLTTAEVRLSSGGPGTSIGKVSSRNGQWYWQHRDGEQSSPIATNRTAAAHALAEYHQAFKSQGPAAPVRRLLFG
jgi:uncharacterized protein YodC (DUF2158 family)